MISSPCVAIIIVNWNDVVDTLECLASVQKLDYPNFFVIVVDNGSTDGSVSAIRSQFPAIPIIESAWNLGYAEGNNIGLRAALSQGADYVLILNNDVRVAPNTISALVQVMQKDPQIGMVGPAVYFDEVPERLFSAGSRIDWWHGQIRHLGFGTSEDSAQQFMQEEISDVDFLVGCTVCVSREAVNAVGELDSAYFLNFEDVEWSVRIRRHGLRVLCVPRAKVWHKLSASLGQASTQNTYYTTRNALRFFSQCASGKQRLIAPLFILGRTLRTVIAWSLKPQYQTEIFHRKRDANLLAVRDFFLKRYGRMGSDIERVCAGN